MYTFSDKNNIITYTDNYENVQAQVTKDHFMGLVGVKEPKTLNWPTDFINSLQNPIDSLPLYRVPKDIEKVAIVIPDVTRGVPTRLILPLIIKELSRAGIGLEKIFLIIALGVHRKASVNEIRNLVGEEYINQIKIFNHDPYDHNKLIYIGKTKYGTPVEINKLVWEADFRITIGKVEPHEFAGFSGGRKSVLPGISSEKTIRMNHRPEMIMKKESRPGKLDNNIIHLDMLEAVKLLKIHFSINFVLNAKGETIGLFSGDIFSAHREAVNFVRSFCEIKLKQIPDIIITTPGYPLNIDFYQSVKPLIALEPICKRDSIIILYSSCPDGFNSPDMLWPFKQSQNIQEVTDKLMKNFKIQMDHALLLTKIINKGIHLIAYSPNVKPEILRTMYFEPAAGLQQAIEKAYQYHILNSKKNDIKILIFPQAQKCLPILVED